jgi:hypothetical protein
VIRLILLLLITGICFTTNAQISYDFGKISMDEMNMRVYAQDSSAKAVILFNKGDVRLDDQLNAVIKRHVRIKFFDQTEVNEWANMTIRLSRSGSSLSKIKGSCYNLENGKIVETKMNEEAIFKTKLNRYYEEVKFALPNVRAGSVIEYSYTTRASASSLPGWQFQYSIPVIETEYEASIPIYYNFRQDVLGYLRPTHKVSESGTVETWTMKNVPAFKKEPIMTTVDDHISRINFYLSEVTIPGQTTIRVLKGWGSVVNGLMEEMDFGGQMRGSGFLKKVVEAEIGDEKDAQKITEKLYAYVKKNVEWNEYTDVIPDHNFKKVLDEKKGSSSEINLLLVTLLQKAGLNAKPVAISTRDYGAVRGFVPMLSQFNDLICSVMIGQKRMLIDATDRYLPMKFLPYRCLSEVGLLIDEKEGEWISLQSARSRLAVTTSVTINNNGELIGDLKINRDGIAASNGRSTIKSKGEKDYVKDLFSGKSWEIKESSYKNLETDALPLEESHAITINDHLQDAGDRIYLNPLIYGIQEENPFKSEIREYPVDFGAGFEDIIISKITIPPGYEVEELPASKALALPAGAGRFVYSSNKSGDMISITCQLIMSKTSFLPEDYPALREFYTQVVAKQTEQLVLKKK